VKPNKNKENIHTISNAIVTISPNKLTWNYSIFFAN